MHKQMQHEELGFGGAAAHPLEQRKLGRRARKQLVELRARVHAAAELRHPARQQRLEHLLPLTVRAARSAPSRRQHWPCIP